MTVKSENKVCGMYKKGIVELGFKAELKSLYFILAQSGNSIIATACPLKFS